jgi:prophage antirepressor-like protein
MNNQIIPFNFENRKVRAVLIGDEPWWVGKDVCDALEIVNNRDAIARLESYEKKMSELPTSSTRQNGWLVNESGVYSLALTSRTDKAKAFKRWLTTVVLPQIRKTGAYVPEAVTQEIKDLQERVLGLELNRSVTEKTLHNALRMIRRYEEQRLMTYADKREILNLYLNKYRISDIQRITKKSRGAIKRFLDWLTDLDDRELEAEIKKIKRAGYRCGMEELFDSFIAASRGKGETV